MPLLAFCVDSGIWTQVQGSFPLSCPPSLGSSSVLLFPVAVVTTQALSSQTWRLLSVLAISSLLLFIFLHVFLAHKCIFPLDQISTKGTCAEERFTNNQKQENTMAVFWSMLSSTLLPVENQSLVKLCFKSILSLDTVGLVNLYPINGDMTDRTAHTSHSTLLGVNGYCVSLLIFIL